MRSLSFIIFLIILFFTYSNAQSPHGKNLKFDCSECHQSNNWNVLLNDLKFDHSKTEFELIDQHANVSCKSCHQSLVFAKAKSKQNCFSCHKDVHQNTVGQDCESCHSTKSWLLTDIDRIHQENRFPLTGLHQAADCIQCHKKFDNFNFEPIGISCYDCHISDYNATNNPNHIAAGFSTSCESCHSLNTNLWSANNINHDFFPLTGGHSLPNCFSCHLQGKPISSIPNDCFSCHKKDFDATLNPNHKIEGFSTDCIQCHNIISFVPSTFQHDNTTFPLTGRHNIINCKDCHTNGYTVTLSPDCYSCHRIQYESTTDPNHVTNAFPTDCAQCHSTIDWLNAKFDHQTTNFPLEGAHTNLDCLSCHSNGYNGTPTDCYSCHKNKYDATTDPNHSTAGFPTDCIQCHTQSAWTPATFDHNNTSFPLQGAHTSLGCVSCHSNGYKGTPTDCYSCHKTNYDNTTDPNHILAGFATDCTQCHKQDAWKPATFDHNTTIFPLEGAHTSLNCNSCHSTGFKGTPTDCYLCHKDQYNSTTDPNHVTSGISTDCTQCHWQINWTQPVIDHGFYPLSSPHLPANITCQSCHSKPNFQPDCWSCHSDDFFKEHKTGDPTDCWRCHKTTNWDANEGD